MLTSLCLLGAMLCWVMCLGFVIPFASALMLDTPGYETIGHPFEVLAALPYGRVDRFDGFVPSPLDAFAPRTQIRASDGSRLPWYELATFPTQESRSTQGLGFGLALGLVAIYLVVLFVSSQRHRNREGPRICVRARGLAAAATVAVLIATLGSLLVLAMRIGWSYANELREIGAYRDDPAGTVIQGGGVYIDGSVLFALDPVAHLGLILGMVLAVTAPAIFIFGHIVSVPNRPGECPACGYSRPTSVCPECGHDAGAPLPRPRRLSGRRVTLTLIYIGLTLALLASPWVITVTLGPLSAWISR